MAKIFKPKSQARQNKKQRQPVQQAIVRGLDHTGKGVVKDGSGNVYFVEGALPDEHIRFRPTGKYHAECIEVLQTADDRRQPPCPYYQQCGGCDLQHLADEQQRNHKQQAVSQLLQKFADYQQVLPWQPTVTNDAWHYRRKARLASHWDSSTKALTLGFRQAKSKTLVAIDQCLVLDKQLSDLIVPLTEQLRDCGLGRELGHVELIKAQQTHIVLRLLKPLSESQTSALQSFAAAHQVQIWLQYNEQLEPLDEASTVTSADRSIDGDTLQFTVGDFLQVNAAVNRQMVTQALDWLQVNPEHRLLDLFAGIGNFTLPLARRAKQVTAIEGIASMTQRIQSNAEQAGLSNVQATTADLSEITAKQLTAFACNLWLLDPARAGAEQVAKALQQVAEKQRPDRILYVSCAPDTLARDSRTILAAGYQIKQLGLVDMFPQTHHIETMVCFERVA